MRYACSPLAVPPELSAIRGVVFDCDGVLVDSRDANRMYYNLIRERMGLLSMTPEEEDYVHTHSVTQSLARVVPPQRLAEAHALRRAFDYRDILPYVYLEPGLRELLVLLRQKKVRMGVLTNRTDTMELVLETFDLGLFFSPVITAGRLSHPRASPEGLHRSWPTGGLTAPRWPTSGIRPWTNAPPERPAWPSGPIRIRPSWPPCIFPITRACVCVCVRPCPIRGSEPGRTAGRASDGG